jgi:hypothetical protein
MLCRHGPELTDETFARAIAVIAAQMFEQWKIRLPARSSI